MTAPARFHSQSLTNTLKKVAALDAKLFEKFVAPCVLSISCFLTRQMKDLCSHGTLSFGRVSPSQPQYDNIYRLVRSPLTDAEGGDYFEGQPSRRVLKCVQIESWHAISCTT